MLAPIAVAAFIWILPTPEGLTPGAWAFLAIFMGVVVGLILEPIPAALIGWIGICLVALLGLMGKTPSDNVKWALSGFSNSIIWLIFAAFMLALGYQKTGLGKRIALLMVRFMGKSSLGLGYAVTFADAILSPFMPSNTARSGGTLYPVITNIPLLFGSTPEKDRRKLGSYLCWTAFAATCVTSSMFLTALAPNLLAVSMINKDAGVMIEWGNWAKIMVPVMLPLLLLTPWLGYVLYPPTQKESPEAPAWAAKELEKLGVITLKEWLMAFYGLMALVLWIFSKELSIDSTLTALIVIALMVLTKVISWEDVISNKAAWNVLIWFSTLVALAGGLKNAGILAWLGQLTQSSLVGLSLTSAALLMLVLFFVLHYFFASTTAHVTALLAIFITTALPIFSPEQMLPFMILLAGSLGVMGVITPYATGPSPIWYGAGYITQAEWWKLGAIFGAIYLVFILAAAILCI